MALQVLTEHTSYSIHVVMDVLKECFEVASPACGSKSSSEQYTLTGHIECLILGSLHVKYHNDV